MNAKQTLENVPWKRLGKIGLPIVTLIAMVIGTIVFLNPLLRIVGLLGLFLFYVGFLFSLGFLPIVTRMPGIVPAIVGEIIANTLWLVGALASGELELYQNADDSYELRRTSKDGGSNRTKFLGVDFHLDYERTPEAFGNLLEEVDTDALADDDAPQSLAEYGPRRAGLKTVIDTKADGPFVRVYQLIERLEAAAGVTDIDRTEQHSITEHAGEDGWSAKYQVMGVLGGAITGGVLGWLTLF